MRKIYLLTWADGADEDTVKPINVKYLPLDLIKRIPQDLLYNVLGVSESGELSDVTVVYLLTVDNDEGFDYPCYELEDGVKIYCDLDEEWF